MSKQSTQFDIHKLEPLVDSSVEALNEYMAGKATDKDKLRIASQTISSYARLRSTEIQGRQFLYQVIKDIANDKDHLRKLVAANMPDAKQLEQ